MSTPSAVVRTCSPTDTSKTGHAIVIVHYLDPTTNTRIFFMGEESSYKERTYQNSSGKNVTERFRRFPSTVTNNAGRNAHAKANANFVAGTDHFVVRKNTRKGNYKYTIQVPKGIWGFPKGAGNTVAETAKEIAAREFLEEVGYTLDKARLVFKKCVDVSRGSEITQSVVFHYELNSKAEHDAVNAAFAALHSAGKGELFNAGFYTEAEVNRKPKNKFSTNAFSDFGLDHSTLVDQTNIPRGGIVVSASASSSALGAGAGPAPAAPAPAAPPVARYTPPHLRPGYVPTAAITTPPAAPSIPPVAPYIPPHRRKTPGGARKSRKRMTRKRR